MTDVEKVRHLCQDMPLFHSEDIELEAGTNNIQKTYQLQYFPLQDGLVVYNDTGTVIADTDYTVDSQPGTVTFLNDTYADSRVKFNYKHTLLPDEAIQLFLDTEGSIKLAAAQALLSIATSQALIQKKIKTLDLETDGPALARALKDLAKEYRDQGKGMDDSSWDIAEQVYDWFGVEEKLLKDIQRES